MNEGFRFAGGGRLGPELSEFGEEAGVCGEVYVWWEGKGRHGGGGRMRRKGDDDVVVVVMCCEGDTGEYPWLIVISLSPGCGATSGGKFEHFSR